MKPDFFDDYNPDEICNPDKSENEIDIDFKPSIKCKSRYILVFELYNEDELKNWEEWVECEKYNDKIIKYFKNTSLFEFEYATNKYHIFNGIHGPKKAIRKRIDTIINFIEAIKNRFSKTTKRVYILDIKEELRLIYAAKIANNNIKNELQELLYKLDEALCSNKEMWDYISIDDIEENIKKQVHLDTASLTIENINSTISDIPQEAKELVNIVANDDEFINNSFDITVRLDANKSFYRWYNFLLSQIKVYLVKKEDMPTMEEYIGKYDIKKEDIDNITQQTRISKALGCYYRNPRNIAGKEVKICICPELIEDFADSIGIDKNIAYAKVIVHEFAHAMMDDQNVVSLDKDKQYLDYTISNNLSFHDPHFWFVMEESVANCITLNKFKASYLKNSDIVINDVIKFIEHQPDAYKFGIKQSNAKIKVCKWRTMKDRIDNTKAEEWLRKYFFNNEPYNAEAFNDLFDTKSNLIQVMRKATILIQDNIDQTYIDLDDILYVHVQKNYTYIHRTDGSESVHLVTLKDVMDKIDAVSDYSIFKFMRLGRSHIVNTAYVSKVEIKRRCITLQCNGRTIELKINSNKNLGNLLKQQMTTDTLIKPRIQYTIDAETYDELCDQIIEIDGVDCVDLDLPSGRKWAIENLEAPLGGIPKMFAWGETTPKINGTKENYLLAKDGLMTKYNAEDGLKQLCPENDAATCILGKKWRTPTLKDFQELMECCKWQWCIWGDYHGCRVIGPNGNSIFLHAGGTASINRECRGYYWTSSLNEPEDNYAYYCTFCEDIEGEDAASLCSDEVEERYWAFYIRPVAD